MSTPIDMPQPHQESNGSPERGASNWLVPAVGVLLGVVALVIEIARGATTDGVVALIIMVGYAGLLVAFGRRSETVSLLRGETVDERAEHIQLRAAALSFYVLSVVLVVGFLVALARGGDDTAVWSGICAVSGVTYMVSLGWLRRRS